MNISVKRSPNLSESFAVTAGISKKKNFYVCIYKIIRSYKERYILITSLNRIVVSTWHFSFLAMIILGC